MSKDYFTDAEVEIEIERLRESEAVKLARREWYVRNRQRQEMYKLRNLEKRGLELMRQGVTFESLDRLAEELDEEQEG